LLLRESIYERGEGFGFKAVAGVLLNGMAESTIRRAGAVESLGLKHDRPAFPCGVDFLDVYLRTRTSQDFKKHAAVPLVLAPDGSTIAGLLHAFGICSATEQCHGRGRKEIAEISLAVHNAHRTIGGKHRLPRPRARRDLVMDALHRILQHSREVASAGVIVDAKDPDAVSFYKKYGFLELPDVERRLFLSMGTVEELFR
jgi:hypothetical protein